MFVSHSLYEGTKFLEFLAVNTVGNQGVGQTELLGGGLAIIVLLVRHIEDVLQAGVVGEQLLVESETNLVPVLLQERTAHLQDPTRRAAQGHSQVYNSMLLSSGPEQERNVLDLWRLEGDDNFFLRNLNIDG